MYSMIDMTDFKVHVNFACSICKKELNPGWHWRTKRKRKRLYAHKECLDKAFKISPIKADRAWEEIDKRVKLINQNQRRV